MLRGLLRAWADAAGSSPAARCAGRDVLRCWSEPWRRYHDLRHLVAVLEHVGEIVEAGEAVRDPNAVRLAAFFHDAVYDPTSGTNEDDSARLARDSLRRMDKPEELVIEVERLVRLTTTHDVESGDQNGAVLCDADLAVLAGPPGAYAAYAADIRAEYHMVGDAEFALGRSRVIAGLLARPALFHTAYGHARWERVARQNMQVELALLTGRPPAGDDEDRPHAAG